MTNQVAWARPWAIAKPFAKPTPRAGAWYPVVGEASEGRVVLEIRGKRVAVQRQLVEIREERPTRFTVVYRPGDAGAPPPGTTRDLGRRYAVCPSCGVRLPLAGEPAMLRCGTCQHRGEVAYWETG